jgi:sec-independent protein translocase protein TatA
MLGLRGWEPIIILVIIILLFGAAKIPQLARSVGKAISEFRKGVKEAKDEFKDIPAEIADVEEEVKNS